ncbi:MAG: TolC family protein [Bacteroidota bacterium]
MRVSSVKRMLTVLIAGLIFLCGNTNLSFSQQQITVSLVSETAQEGDHFFEEDVKNEITVLLSSRYDIQFREFYADNDVAELASIFDAEFANTDSDIVISIGALASHILTTRTSYSKPAIAGIVIDNEIQGVGITDEGTSGVPNFTYIESPFDIFHDLSHLHRIIPYTNLGVVGNSLFVEGIPNFNQLFDSYVESIGATWTYYPILSSPEGTVNSITDDVDAIYLLPHFNLLSNQELEQLLGRLADRKIPVFALLSEHTIEAGAYAAHETENNLSKIPRRIALNIYKIIEGQNAGDLPVAIQTFSEDLIINMATVRKTGLYPDWDLMAESILVNLFATESENVVNIRSVIAEALIENLGLKIAGLDTEIQDKEIALAKADRLPQADISTAFSVIDKSSAERTFGAQGRMNWTASGDLTQVIFSEPLMANIAIQELLKQTEAAEFNQVELDLILESATAYLNILQAKSLAAIQIENVNLTRENLNIAKAKQAVGYTGATDINRWETELALANIDLNDAVASAKQTEFNLNYLLNRPIAEEFTTEDVTLGQDQILLISNPQILGLIKNPGDLDRFADFMVSEALRDLPEIQQLDLGIDTQERLMLSQKREWYLPSVAFSGGIDHIIDRYAVPETGMPLPEKNPSWNLGIGVSYPLFQGGKRKINVQQTELKLLQLDHQRNDLVRQLEFRVRANMETAGASFSRMELSVDAATAARKNFDIVQDSYSKGLANVTTLIDAQSSALQTELSAANAVYQFIIDFLSVDRAIGSYYFLKAPAEREAFFQRMATFLSDNQ